MSLLPKGKSKVGRSNDINISRLPLKVCCESWIGNIKKSRASNKLGLESSTLFFLQESASSQSSCSLLRTNWGWIHAILLARRSIVWLWTKQLRRRLVFLTHKGCWESLHLFIIMWQTNFQMNHFLSLHLWEHYFK